MIVLGIETSCDETASAIVNSDHEILSESIYSQIKTHEEYLGVVPELAARSHIDYCDKIIKATIAKANISIKEIDAVAATAGPGLLGGLLVGLTTAKSISLAINKPFVAINHLDGHALTPRLSHKLQFPYLLLLISGGHTMFLSVEGPGKYKVLGQSIDDAMGEAFDKTGRLLGLGYPGGPEIEHLALGGNTEKFKLPMPLTKKNNCDFSFSGLKTAALNTIKNNKKTKTFMRDFSASFQHTVSKVLEIKILNSIKLLQKENIKINDFSICGGVAANKYLNTELQKLISTKKLNFHQVPLSLCTDNAAMIGWNAIEYMKTRKIKFNNYNTRPSPNILIHEHF